jgi:hypothetical protein
MSVNDALIIVSTPRSGSSWLSRILRAHPGLYVYTHNTNNTQLLYLLYPLKTFNPFGDDTIGDGALSEKLLKSIRVRIVSKYYRSTSPDRKLTLASPTNVGFLPLLMDVFPNAKYVHLKRNPLDVIASFRSFLNDNANADFKKRFKETRYRGLLPASLRSLAHLFHNMRWLRVSGRGYVGTRPPGFQKSAKLPLLEFLTWYYFRLEAQIEEALAQIPADRKYEVTYEGLVTNHEAELKGLVEFMGVDFLEEHLQKTSGGIRTGGVSRHKQHFSEKELDEVRRYVGIYGGPAVSEISADRPEIAIS